MYFISSILLFTLAYSTGVSTDATFIGISLLTAAKLIALSIDEK